MIDFLIKELDKLPGNNERKNYLERIIQDPNIGRHDLKRIACITLIEGNFIENYYKVTLFQQIINNLKKRYNGKYFFNNMRKIFRTYFRASTRLGCKFYW